MEPKKLTINGVERSYEMTIDDEMAVWHHAYLLLMDETDPSRPIAIQELHFNEGENGHLMPNVRDIHKPFEPSDCKTVFPYLGGSEADILAVWNHGLAHAVYLRDRTDIKFGYDYRVMPYSNNCRTGEKVILETMGLTFSQDFAKSTAGTLANGVPIGKPYNYYEPITLAVDALKEANMVMAKKLAQPQISDMCKAPTPDDFR